MVAPLLIHSLNGLLIVYSGKDMVALLIELYEWKILQHKYLSSKQPQKQSINFCGGVLCDQDGEVGHVNFLDFKRNKAGFRGAKTGLRLEMPTCERQIPIHLLETSDLKETLSVSL